WSYRVEPDHMQRVRGVGWLGRLPQSFEASEGTREARRERMWEVVIPRDRKHGWAERAQEVRGAHELIGPAAVTQISARDDQFGCEAFDEDGRAVLDRLVVSGSVMQIGEVQNACKHGRSRL